MKDKSDIRGLESASEVVRGEDSLPDNAVTNLSHRTAAAKRYDEYMRKQVRDYMERTIQHPTKADELDYLNRGLPKNITTPIQRALYYQREYEKAMDRLNRLLDAFELKQEIKTLLGRLESTYHYPAIRVYELWNRAFGRWEEPDGSYTTVVSKVEDLRNFIAEKR